MMEDAKAQGEAMTKREEQEIKAKAMAELQKAEAEMLRAKKTGVSANFKAEDFANYPQLLAIYQGLIAGEQQQQMPAPEPQPMQQPQPQPAMAGAM
jgi:hypothetical protein